jgi:hypothetical protein
VNLSEGERESERERVRERKKERERYTKLLEFSIFQKNRDQNLENRFPVPKFERKKMKFPFPFSKSGTGKS